MVQRGRLALRFACAKSQRFISLNCVNPGLKTFNLLALSSQVPLNFPLKTKSKAIRPEIRQQPVIRALIFGSG